MAFAAMMTKRLEEGVKHAKALAELK